jgi:outer membrane protein OmpA-like peptidoglycan-associated protein
MHPCTCRPWDSIITGSDKAATPVTRIHITLCTSLVLGLAAVPSLGWAVTFDWPANARTVATKAEALTSYPLPIGAFVDGKMQTRLIEGPMAQTVWQIDTPDQTTLQLLMPLRAQLTQAGYSVLFECQAVQCGGFDFRYGTPVLPEPEMHVDLGDYRFLSAEKGAVVISLLVSRSSATGFVQLTQMGASAATTAVKTTMAEPDPVPAGGPVAGAQGTVISIDSAAAPQDLGMQLSAGGAVVLDDLVFASAASALSEGTYPSLGALSDWLRAHPDLRVTLVGHTDASGSLDGNIALSRQRAQSVRQRMVERYDIPPQQVDAEGVGYLAPRASNLSDTGREQNRRVEVMMTSPPVTP